MVVFWDKSKASFLQRLCACANSAQALLLPLLPSFLYHDCVEFILSALFLGSHDAVLLVRVLLLPHTPPHPTGLLLQHNTTAKEGVCLYSPPPCRRRGYRGPGVVFHLLLRERLPQTDTCFSSCCRPFFTDNWTCRAALQMYYLSCQISAPYLRSFHSLLSPNTP